MKVNPIGINAYRPLNQQSPKTAEQSKDQAAVTSLTIEPQNSEETSKLAVSASSGTYASYLDAEEKQALEVLFQRFQDAGRFGPGYKGASETAPNENGLGNKIDIKV